MGKYPPPKGASVVLGLEFAGEIIEAGKEVTKWKKGDLVPPVFKLHGRLVPKFLLQRPLQNTRPASITGQRKRLIIKQKNLTKKY